MAGDGTRSGPQINGSTSLPAGRPGVTVLDPTELRRLHWLVSGRDFERLQPRIEPGHYPLPRLRPMLCEKRGDVTLIRCGARANGGHRRTMTGVPAIGISRIRNPDLGGSVEPGYYRGVSNHPRSRTMPARKPTSKKKTPPDNVELASRAIERAIVKLVKLVGDENPGVVSRALTALDILGPAAIVGPLAGGLNKASSRHRKFLITALVQYDKEPCSRTLSAVCNVALNEGDRQVVALAKCALATLTSRRDASRSAACARGRSAHGDGVVIDCEVEPSRVIDITPSDHPDEPGSPLRGTTRLKSWHSSHRWPKGSGGQ